MNWTRTLVGGVLAGVVTFFADFVQHGVLLADTYKKHALFSQTPASPLFFLAASVLIGILVAILFGKTRGSWAAGWKGGATFGFFFGMAIFFGNFYSPLVLAGFPYHLAWCWGGIGLIDALLAGAVLGAVVRRD